MDRSQGSSRFFRDRLALLCKVIAGINVGYFALFVLALSLDAKVSYFSVLREAFSLETLGEYVLLAGVLLGCRFGGGSLRVLRVLDAVLLCGLGCLWSSWCFMHPYAALGAYEMVLALVAAPVLRAVLVPSSGVRTLLLTAAACTPGLAASFVASRVRHLTMMTPATLTVLVFNWCAISIVFSTVASSVIYGLRSQVRRARRLGQYTLLAKIGQGGMGTVYLAQHALLRRRTVVKVVGDDAPVEAIDRFEREVQLTSQLTHPNTIAIYDFGRTDEGAFYYAMEHLEGTDLERLVATAGPLTPARVIHLLRQVCGALDEAHGCGLLHRDIKPSNIFLCPRRGLPDVAKVLDFGLVKDLRATSASSALTRENSFVGTPLYMSPEMVSAKSQLDARSDIYALGAVAYYLLAGVPLFSGSSVLEVCSQHLCAAPIPPSERSPQQVPLDLELVVLRCLEKEPADRYADVRALREALDACEDAQGWSEADAERWWAEHRLTLEAAQAPAGDDAPPTIAVDLNRRLLGDAA
jgi:eukaryotic-like serine/threonine-protein kinase